VPRIPLIVQTVHTRRWYSSRYSHTRNGKRNAWRRPGQEVGAAAYHNRETRLHDTMLKPDWTAARQRKLLDHRLRSVFIATMRIIAATNEPAAERRVFPDHKCFCPSARS